MSVAWCSLTPSPSNASIFDHLHTCKLRKQQYLFGGSKYLRPENEVTYILALFPGRSHLQLHTHVSSTGDVPKATYGNISSTGHVPNCLLEQISGEITDSIYGKIPIPETPVQKSLPIELRVTKKYCIILIVNIDNVSCNYLHYFHQCYASSNVDPAYKESGNV